MNGKTDFRLIKFYNPENYEKFLSMCKNKKTSATREINFLISEAVKTGYVLSDPKL